MDPALRCAGSIRADVVEPQVWAAIVRVLEQPELIAAEVARQEGSADEQRADIRRQLGIIEGALAKCDWEAQRWVDAYAQEVINVAELKSYRAQSKPVGRAQSGSRADVWNPPQFSLAGRRFPFTCAIHPSETRSRG